MIPNMFKIAGELTPTVFHVAARALAAQALSIFGDHSDVMAARHDRLGDARAPARCRKRTTSRSIAQSATLASRIPFLHFFDGFRTSHEVSKIEMLDRRRCAGDDRRRARVRASPARALNPDRPVVRGVAQNPDVYFQARETREPVSTRRCPAICAAGDGPVRRPDRPRSTSCSTTSARRTPSACSS